MSKLTDLITEIETSLIKSKYEYDIEYRPTIPGHGYFVIRVGDTPEDRDDG